MKIQDLLQLCLSKWYWFVISLGITLSAAVLYVKRTPSVYTRTASILIKDETSGKSASGDVAELANLGLIQTNTNVNNEIIAFQSPALMQEVVKRLRLDVNYVVEGRLHEVTLYGGTLPVNVSFPDLSNDEVAGLTVRLLADRRVALSEFRPDGEPLAEEVSCTATLGDTVSTPVGAVVVMPTRFYRGEYSFPIVVSKSSLYSVTRGYAGALTVALRDEKSSVIDLSINDVCTQRAEDVLSTLIAVYNDNWIREKNAVTASTSLLIDERLGVIERELSHIDDDISSYKSENLMPDVQSVSSMYMAKSSETETEIQLLNNQLYMARYIRNYLTSLSQPNQLLPVNSGVESASLEDQIAEYNTLQLERNNLITNSSEANPLIQDLDHSLAAMREAILISLDNLITTLTAQIDFLKQEELKTKNMIAASPVRAKYLLSVERQQMVKESLYLFLLQKREENELSQTFTAYNTRVINPPAGSPLPTEPKKGSIMLIALAIGLFLPVVILFMMEMMDTTVRNRKDLEGLSAPFVGEIPLYEPKKKHLLSQHKEMAVVVREKGHDVVNEAFRIVRTNLEFMDGGKTAGRTIMITSMNPGSGKTFISLNLALSFAIKGKKVLVIDLDMRRKSLSNVVDRKIKTGISNYLAEQVDALDEIILRHPLHANLDVIPVGTIPPNPTELLFSKRLESMLAELRKEYDLILIDCPPSEIVADVAIVNEFVDVMLFIVRAGLFERSMLPDLDNFYTSRKYKNMSLVLNATKARHAQQYYGKYYGKYYGHKYYYDK